MKDAACTHLVDKPQVSAKTLIVMTEGCICALMQMGAICRFAARHPPKHGVGLVFGTAHRATDTQLGLTRKMIPVAQHAVQAWSPVNALVELSRPGTTKVVLWSSAIKAPSE